MTLRGSWSQHKHRPAWVQRHRDALEAATDLEIPQSLPEIQQWLTRYMGVVTRRLNDHEVNK